MSYIEDLLTDFDKALLISKEMRKVYDHCYDSDNFDDIMWKVFWNLSGEFPFAIDYYDPDTSYEEDMRARLWAVEEYIESYKAFKEKDYENQH